MYYRVANHVDQENVDLAIAQVPAAVTLAAAAFTGPQYYGAQTNITYQVVGNDFVWEHAIAVATGDFAFRINAQSEGCYLDNDRVPGLQFWGSTAFPNKIPPKFFRVNDTIVFELWNQTNAPIDVQLMLWGRRADRHGRDEARYGAGHGLVNLVTPMGGVKIAGGVGTGTGGYPVQQDAKYAMRVKGIASRYSNATFSGQIRLKDPRDEIKRYLWNPGLYLDQSLWSGTTGGQQFIPPNAPIVEENTTVELSLLNGYGFQQFAVVLFTGEKGLKQDLIADAKLEAQARAGGACDTRVPEMEIDVYRPGRQGRGC